LENLKYYETNLITSDEDYVDYIDGRFVSAKSPYRERWSIRHGIISQDY